MVSKGKQTERKVARQNWRDKELERHAPTRYARRVIYVVSEGSVTEPRYFKRFANDHRAIVSVVLCSDHGVPKTVVARAIEEKQASDLAHAAGDSELVRDEVWAVIDRDKHDGVEKAMDDAKKAGVFVALSNPCFELWALLHFQDHAKYNERHTVQRMVKSHLRDYEKDLDYEKLRPGYAQAVKRAKALERDAVLDNDPHKNPTTAVYRLTESIRLSGLTG